MNSLNNIVNRCVILFLVTVVFVSSCKSSGSISKTSKKQAAAGLSEQNEIKFAAMFIDGCKERMRGNFELAENLFKECLKLNPNSAAVKYELGNLYRLDGLYDNATKYAKECANADPKNEWYQLLLIDCYHHKNQYAQAADIYSRLIKNFPEHPEYYEGLAAEYMYNGNYEKSYKTYDELEKKFGADDIFTINKIKLLKQLKKNTEAEQEFFKLIEKRPKEARYYTYLAEFYQENQQMDKALEIYKKSLIINPNNPMVHLALADYYQKIKDFDNAFKEIKIAFLNPDLEVETKLKIMISYFQLSENDEIFTKQAYELCDIMLKLHPSSPESHSVYADFLYRDKKVKQARDEYEAAAKLDKSRFAIWNQLMTIDSELNDNEALINHSKEAIELFPNQPMSYYFNGFANIQLKNYEAATVALEEGLEFVYNNKALSLEFYINLGNAYNYLKNYEKSDKAFEDALKYNPDNTEVLNNYAYYLSLRKTNLSKAEKLSKRSNELAPNKRNYIDTYGWILYQLGKYEEAELWLKRAAKMGADNFVILEHYGDVLFQLNKIEEAVNYWKEAKKAGSNSELLDKKISNKKLYE